MFDKFNFYDILGYLIPGGAVFLLLYLAGTPIITGDIPRLKGGDIPDLASTVGGGLLLVGISYAIGHLVQSVGELWEKVGNWTRRGRLSEQMLGPKDKTFDSVGKELIKTKGKTVFGLPDYPTDEKELMARYTELFELCYRQMVQKTQNAHTDLYLSISALSRGLVVVSWLGFWLGVALLARQVILLNAFNKSDVPSIGLGVVLLAASLITSALARYHYYRFRHYYAASVWQNFLVP